MANIKDAEQSETISTLRRASNQVSVRDYNERVILQLIRENGSITKAEATRATGLSANATSVIFKSLEADNLLQKGEPIRGKIGQPSIPISLNPNAVYFTGMKLGRRSADMVLMDFAGNVVARDCIYYAFPLPDMIIEFAQDSIKQLAKKARIARKKIAGLGIAMPFELWSWTEDFDAPNEEMQIWKDFDLKSALQKNTKLPVHIINDGTAACSAELTHSGTKKSNDFIYLFVGTFIGGGIVINGSIYSGRSGNAGGFGPMPIPGQNGENMRLVDCASIAVLEKMIQSNGGDPKSVWHADGEGWHDYKDLVDQWASLTARGLAYAIVSSSSVLDFDLVIIDGAVPDVLRRRIIQQTAQEVDQLDLQGITRPDIKTGSFGDLARAIGAASVLISKDYSVDQNTLLRR